MDDGVVPPGWLVDWLHVSTQPKQPKNTVRSWAGQSLSYTWLAPRIIFHSFFVISTYGMKPISITFQPPSPPPFSALRLASNGENIGQAIIGLLYGYIARGAAGGSDQGDGPSERGGHFGSEPAGAKLFDPAILDFGAAASAAGIGRGMDGLGVRTPLPPPRGSRA